MTKVMKTFFLEPVVLKDAYKYVKNNELGSLSRLLRHLLKVELYRDKTLKITNEDNG